MFKLIFLLFALVLAESNMVMGGWRNRYNRYRWTTTTTSTTAATTASSSSEEYGGYGYRHWSGRKYFERMESSTSSYSLLSSLKCLSPEQKAMIESCNTHSSFKVAPMTESKPNLRKRREYPFTPSNFAVCLVTTMEAYNNSTGEFQILQLEQGMIEKSNLQAAAKKVARDTLFSCMSPPTSIETEQDDQGTQDYANSEDDYTINTVSKGLLCSAEALIDNGCNAVQQTSRFTGDIEAEEPKFENMRRGHHKQNDTSSSESTEY